MATAEAESSQDERVPPGGLVYDGFISYSHAADDLLAPRLQSGLQRFAKPWWKRRALRIFRDESSLSANPHLWSSITDALDGSAWFVLLLSPDAAESPWVNNEVEYWLANKDADRIIPVLTDGDFTWYDNDFISDAVPPALQGAFSDEPRWVDLRFARTEEQLDLQNPEFSAAVADIASAIRGVPKDELASEEVRQHRRTVRTAWGAGAVVLALAVAAGGTAIFAVGQRNEAQTQTEVAETERDRAIAAEDAATVAAEAEAEQRAAAVLQADLARGRELAASAIVAAEADAQLSLLLALEAIDQLPEGEAPGPTLENALREAMAANSLLGKYALGDQPGETPVANSPNGEHLAVAYRHGVELLDARTLEPIWRYEEETEDVAGWVGFSSDGEILYVSIHDSRYSRISFSIDGEPTGEPDARLLLFDAATGELVRTEVFSGACSVNAVPGAWRSDLNLFGFGFTSCEDEDKGLVRFVEPDTWTTVFEWESVDLPHAVFAPEGSLVGVFNGFNTEPGSELLDSTSWAVVLDDLPYAWGAFSPDGSALAASSYQPFSGIELIDTASGDLIDRFPITRFPWNPQFSPDGNNLAVASMGDSVSVFDVDSGEVINELGTGSTDGFAYNGSDVHTSWDGEVSVWDVSGASQGDLNTVPLGLWVNGNSIFHGGTVAAHIANLGTDEWWIYPVDPETGALGTPIDGRYQWTPIAGNRIVRHPERDLPDGSLEIGPLQVVDLDTGEATDLAGCWLPANESGYVEGVCPDGTPHPNGLIAQGGDRDGSEFLLFDWISEDAAPAENFATIWSSETLEPVERISLGVLPSCCNHLRFSKFNDDHIVLIDRWEETVRVVDRATGEHLELDGYDNSLGAGHGEHDRGKNRVWITGGANVVWVVDLDTLTASQITERLPAIVRALATSPSGNKIAVGTADDTLRIYSDTGEVLHQIPLTNPSDAWWLDETHLTVGTATGPWTTITLDTAELIDIARSRVLRQLTGEECEFYELDC